MASRSSSAIRRRRARVTVAFVAGFAMLAAASWSGISCISTDSYVFSAQRYDPDNACLDAYEPIDIVNGSSASSTCIPTCLSVDGDVFVTTMCPPLPSVATFVPADTEECKAALAAYNQSFSCDSVEPAEEEDAGEEEGDGGEEDAPVEDGGEDADPDDASDADARPMDARAG